MIFHKMTAYISVKVFMHVSGISEKNYTKTADPSEQINTLLMNTTTKWVGTIFIPTLIIPPTATRKMGVYP